MQLVLFPRGMSFLLLRDYEADFGTFAPSDPVVCVNVCVCVCMCVCVCARAPLCACVRAFSPPLLTLSSTGGSLDTERHTNEA